MASIPFINIRLLVITLGLVGIFPASAVPAATESIVVCDGDLMRINAQGTPIAAVLDDIQQECGIRVDGLQAEPDRPVLFSQTGNRQDILRSLLQILDVTNYALEYRNDLLIQVTVLPVSTIPDAARPETTDIPSETAEKPFADGLRIVDVIEGSQADFANLQEGDLILYYDGQRVTRPAELVRLSQERGSQEAVELMLIRDRAPIRVYLNGGFIGIRIRTGLMDRSVLEKYLDIME
ncbi:hypothetical protein D3OALGA1CA_4832 [Olavius algarvensis associated proteobacterium Delta 3]|nr:hypothetical protein D3OALGA1CA_4832 [Olavius algarvensis associated proteobacterium Delta 3]